MIEICFLIFNKVSKTIGIHFVIFLNILGNFNLFSKTKFIHFGNFQKKLKTNLLCGICLEIFNKVSETNGIHFAILIKISGNFNLFSKTQFVSFGI